MGNLIGTSDLAGLIEVSERRIWGFRAMPCLAKPG